MRVMVIVKATADSEAGKLPSIELMAAMGAFNQKLIAAGVMMDGGGLKPTAQGAHRLRRRGPHSQARPLRRHERARVRLLDLERPEPRSGDRLGQAMPQSDARTLGDRNPPVLRNGGFRLSA